MATAEAIARVLGERRNVIVAGIRRDGRPSLTPNWFHWDGERFYISTMRGRAKYALFRRDPRVQLVVDDSTGHRYVQVDARVDIWEDHDRGLAFFRAIREKYGREVGDDAALKANLQAEDRVLLVITPDRPPEEWPASGLD
jgi:PPOX class probable F420-dependent enzyme